MLYRRLMLLLSVAGLALALTIGISTTRVVVAQQPTGSIPTVTGTPTGPTVSVDPSLGEINVYSGPSSFNYPAVGILLTGEPVPALARAQGIDDWIMIRYPGVPGSVGWVYGLYVSLSNTGGADLPRVEVPSTPTPGSTPTINPTLAAAFIAPVNATRLPTFTPPAPQAIPTFADPANRAGRIPVGLLILGFAVVGVLGTLISFLRGR